MTPRPSGTPLVVLRGSLVTFVPCCPSRCSCSESRRPSSTARSFLRRSSSTASSFFLLGHRQRALIPTAPLISCPCFYSVRVLLFSSRSMSPSPSLDPRFSSSLSASSSCPSSPSSAPAPVLPASSYTSSGSRLLLVSFSPRRAGLFAGAEASPGLLENGENGRTGTRMRG